MDNNWFRLTFLVAAGAFGFWYWRDSEERTEAAQEAQNEKAEVQRSDAYQTIHKVEDRTVEAAAAYDKRVQQQNVDE